MSTEFNQQIYIWLLGAILVAISAGLGFMIKTVRVQTRHDVKLEAIPRIEQKQDLQQQAIIEIGKTLAEILPTIGLHSKLADETIPEFRRLQTEMEVIKHRLDDLDKRYARLC